MNALRHRRFTWLKLAIALWLSVFSSYALAMQAGMQVGMILAAAQHDDETPCVEHTGAAQKNSGSSHDCPICHVIGSGWVQTVAAIPVQVSAPAASPVGRLFHAIEHLPLADLPPPIF